MLHVVGQQFGQRGRLLVLLRLARRIGRRLFLRSLRGGLLLGLLGRFLLRVFGGLFLGILGGFLLRLLSGLLLGLLGCSLFLGFLGRLLLGDIGLLLLLGRLLFRLGLGCGFLLLRFGLGRRRFLLLLRFGLLSLLSLFGLLLFRSLGRRDALLLDFALLHLLGFVLRGSGLLRLAGDFLVGLHRRLTLRFQLVQGRLDDRPRRRQLRSHGEADEHHGENQDMQAHRQDGRPEITFRGGALTLVHQGASVISPTLPTPASCKPPMAAMTAP
ncbi:hypothetical protein D3C78_913180 [compost metagenome]